MPIHIDVRINEDTVTRVHIGRMEALRGQAEAHRYRIVEMDVPDYLVDYDHEFAEEFTHVYGDGLFTCIAKGLEALENARTR